MNQREISAVINKRFKKIEVLFHKIISGFEMESIHEFRTQIKKLRAFLRLLNVEIDDDNQLKIPKRIKAFYAYSGTIRNLQLQGENMCAYIGNPGYTVAEIYIDYLKKIIEKWKDNAIEFEGLKNNFYNDEKKILKQLPGKLRKGYAKKFLQNKLNVLASLIKKLPDDDALHCIRKLLKDILYNWTLIKQYSKLLPPDFSEEEKIKSFTELLGLFMDKRTAINLLETYCKDCEENGFVIEKEMREIQEIEHGWKREKMELAQAIYFKCGLLNLSPVS
jgi:CHAD domain-containing protein